MAKAVGTPFFVNVAIAADISSKEILFTAARDETFERLLASSPKVVFPSLTVVNIVSATFCASLALSPKEFKTVVKPSAAVAVSVIPPIAAFDAASRTLIPSAPSNPAETI